MAPGTSEATEAQGSGFRPRARLPCWDVPRSSLDSVLGLKTLIVLVETARLWLPVPDCCILGCLWAASLRLRFIREASRARRMVAMTSPRPTASLPFTCLRHQRVEENHYFHFIFDHRDGLKTTFLVPFLLKKGQRCVQLAACWPRKQVRAGGWGGGVLTDCNCWCKTTAVRLSAFWSFPSLLNSDLSRQR